ncbi:MAG: glutamine synthetase family protein [Pseudomonadota bacterium]
MRDAFNLEAWLNKHKIETVEMFVCDMNGFARGKVQPIEKLHANDLKLPLGLLAQTITSGYVMDGNVEDRDMIVKPDPTTVRLIPWAKRPAASVMLDCYDDGKLVSVSPRAVLGRVIERYAEKGWSPVVAPEAEFYLLKTKMTEDDPSESADHYSVEFDQTRDPYGISELRENDGFFSRVHDYCQQQDIKLGAFSQELGPGQFEVNFEHGCPLKAADDLFHFKRTLKQAAREYDLCVTFLAKPLADEAGSSIHIHQSVVDGNGNNIFSNEEGGHTKLFEYFIGGLQKYMPQALLMFAPYANSYRRFLSYYASPINLEWGVENRSVGLRAPDCPPQARRVENRLAGSDINPYLAISATLACGYLGMVEKQLPRPAVEGSAYEAPFALHRHLYGSLDALQNSDPLREVLGDEFVTLLCAVKALEYQEFQARVTDWERDDLVRML